MESAAVTEAVEVLAEVGGVAVSQSSGWRIGQVWGQRLQAELASEETEQKAAARSETSHSFREVETTIFVLVYAFKWIKSGLISMLRY